MDLTHEQSSTRVSPPLAVIANCCQVILHYAALDHTQLYLELLPPDVRASLDHYRSWRHGGSFRPVELSPRVGVINQCLALDVGGEEVLIIACSAPDSFQQQTQIRRLERSESDPYRLVILEEAFYRALSTHLQLPKYTHLQVAFSHVVDEYGAPLLLLLKGLNSTSDIILRDTWGNLIQHFIGLRT